MNLRKLMEWHRTRANWARKEADEFLAQKAKNDYKQCMHEYQEHSSIVAYLSNVIGDTEQ